MILIPAEDRREKCKFWVERMPINIRMVSYRFWRWIAGEEKQKKKNWKPYLYAGSLSFFFLDIDMYLIAEGFDLEKKRYESQGNNNKKKKRRTRMLLIDGLWPASRLARSLHVMLRRWICLRVIFFFFCICNPLRVCLFSSWYIRTSPILSPLMSLAFWLLYFFSLGTVEWAPSSLYSPCRACFACAPHPGK